MVMFDKPTVSYALATESEVLTSLNTSTNGLSKDEVKKRLGKYGLNTLSIVKKNSVLLEFLSNFNSPLVIILISISLVSFFLGEHIDALIVALMVIMSVGLNFYQEHR